MPGTRTAPTVDGTPNYQTVSFTWYDYTGDQRTDTYPIDTTATSAEIEALAVALQAASNGTLWKIQVSQNYNSVGSKTNAIEEVWENVKDNVTILYKNAQNNGDDFFIPSPINAMFVEGTENIDPANAVFGAVLTAIDAIKTSYSAVSARLSHRKQIGKRVGL